jgi:hypothetical protein
MSAESDVRIACFCVIEVEAAWNWPSSCGRILPYVLRPRSSVEPAAERGARVQHQGRLIAAMVSLGE